MLGGAVLIAPGVSYSQNWIQKTTNYKWNDARKKVDTSFHKGIFIEHQASFSLGLNTALFGMYQFKSKKLMAIRHVVRPSLSFSYTPDFNAKHIKPVIVDTLGTKLMYNEIGGFFYNYSFSRQGASISFQLDNSLEGKIRSKKDTTDGGIKKIRLLDAYGFSTSYNLMADSFALSQFNLYARTTLFEKVNITASAILNPYDYNNRGLPVNKLFRKNGKFSLGRLTTANLSLNTDFKSKPKDPEKAKQQQTKPLKDILNDPNLIDQQNLLDYMRQNPAEFVDFNIPWSISLGVSVYYYQQFDFDYSIKKKLTASANFNGNVNLTEKWNLNANGYYNFDTRKLQTFQMNITRDMHCWQMSISVTPVGLYRYFSINISPKASILQDLKINRTRYFTNY
ncbi:MAG: hypothetical protein C4308_11270 [Chitinophagaceae bacterium]